MTNSAVMDEMVDAPAQSDDLPTAHNRLYEAALQYRRPADAKESRDSQRDLRNQIRSFLERLERESGSGISLEGYQRLLAMVLQWKVLFSSAFNEPVDVHLAPPNENILPALNQGRALATVEIDDRIRVAAKVRWIYRMKWRDSEWKDTEAEKLADWRYAEALFVSDIIDGRLNFAGRIASREYWRLEQEWLKYVKCMGAYFLWERRGSPQEPGSSAEDYLHACNHIQNQLMNRFIKARVQEFGEAKAYLLKKYLTPKGKLDRAKAHELIRRKANRVWGMTGGEGEKTDWLNSETYCVLFYENIIAAAENRSMESTSKVLDAFRLCQRQGQSLCMTTCFEAVLAIYFLDADVVQRYLSQNLPFPGTSILL